MAQLHDRAARDDDHEPVLVARGQQLSFSVAVPAGSETQSLASAARFRGFRTVERDPGRRGRLGVQQQISGRATTFCQCRRGLPWFRRLIQHPAADRIARRHAGDDYSRPAGHFVVEYANATSVSIDQGIGAVGATGSRGVNPLVTTTYTITATNSAGSATAPATLTVIPPPPTVTATVNPTTLRLGIRRR